MTEQPASQVLGRWRIVEIEGWDADYIDMLGPGHIQLDRDGGTIEFGVVQIGLECWYSRPASTSTSMVATRTPRFQATATPI